MCSLDVYILGEGEKGWIQRETTLISFWDVVCKLRQPQVLQLPDHRSQESALQNKNFFSRESSCSVFWNNMDLSPKCLSARSVCVLSQLCCCRGRCLWVKSIRIKLTPGQWRNSLTALLVSVGSVFPEAALHLSPVSRKPSHFLRHPAWKGSQ